MPFNSPPTLEEGTATLAGRTKNGARLACERDLVTQFHCGPATRPLTRRQVSCTCRYNSGLLVDAIRPRLTGGWHHKREYSTVRRTCSEPDHVDPGTPPLSPHGKRTGFDRMPTIQVVAR